MKGNGMQNHRKNCRKKLPRCLGVCLRPCMDNVKTKLEPVFVKECLKLHEEYQVRRFLPQLFADMLAMINMSNIPLGCENEKVQLGFAVDGFKLRFAKLVLRHTGDTMPSVAAIRSPEIRCDMFLTKEYNLFNKRVFSKKLQMLNQHHSRFLYVCMKDFLKLLNSKISLQVSVLRFLVVAVAELCLLL